MLIRFLAWFYGIPASTVLFVLGPQDLWRKKVFLTTVSTFVSTVIGFAIPLLLKWGIDIITVTNGGDNYVWQLPGVASLALLLGLAVASYVIIQIIQLLVHTVVDWLEFHLNMKINNAMQDGMIEHLKKFDYVFLSSEGTQAIVRQIKWEISRSQLWILNTLAALVRVPVSVAGFVFAAFLLDWVVIGMLIGLTLIVMLLETLKATNWKKYEVSESRASSLYSMLEWRILDDYMVLLNNNWLSKLYSTAKLRRSAWQKIQVEQKKGDVFFSLLSSGGNLLGNGAISAYAAFMAFSGSITVGTFSVFTSYTSQVRELLETAGFVIRDRYEVIISLNKVHFLLSAPSELDHSGTKVVSTVDHIAIRDLVCTYPSAKSIEREYVDSMKQLLDVTQDLPVRYWWQPYWRKFQSSMSPRWLLQSVEETIQDLDLGLLERETSKPVLHGVTLHFDAGKTYGIVGSNGAGKSTLMRILKHSLAYQEGEIRVNGYEFNELDTDAWRSMICSIEQVPTLVNGLTVRENILLGSDSTRVTDEEIISLLDNLGLEDPQLDSVIGTDARLSGGQKQLVEIARALIRPKPVILIDEGTNQLDAVKERKVIDLITSVAANSIVIFITHRVTTLRHAHVLYTLVNGAVEAAGSPSELLLDKETNEFKTFWNIQVEQ